MYVRLPLGLGAAVLCPGAAHHNSPTILVGMLHTVHGLRQDGAALISPTQKGLRPTPIPSRQVLRTAITPTRMTGIMSPTQ